MMVEQLLDTRDAEEHLEARPDFGQRQTLQVAVTLRNLAVRGDFLIVEYGDKQIVTQLLDVDPRTATFIFDFSHLPDEQEHLLAADELVFRASPDGVRTEFATSAAFKVSFEGRVAFQARFPRVLYYVQRREYFRVEAPVGEPFIATGRYPDVGTFRFEVQDMSLGGVALRTIDPRLADLETGTVLHDVVLDLGAAGELRVDLELRSPRQSTTAKGGVLYVAGFRFVELSGSAERTMQRLITQLEAKRRSLTAGATGR
jgi:flagellar brake protein